MTEFVGNNRFALDEARNALRTWVAGEQFIQDRPADIRGKYEEAVADGIEYLSSLGLNNPGALLMFFNAQMILPKAQRDTWGRDTSEEDKTDELIQKRAMIEEACYFRKMNQLIADQMYGTAQ